jgi:hypothetical protein
MKRAKIVRYGGHCDKSCNEWRLRKYVHLKYILWHFENYKKKSLSLIEFFVGINIFNQVNQARCNQRLRNQNKNSIIRWLACTCKSGHILVIVIRCTICHNVHHNELFLHVSFMKISISCLYGSSEVFCLSYSLGILKMTFSKSHKLWFIKKLKK